jgi:uncharacterized protein (TIGR02246 family)
MRKLLWILALCLPLAAQNLKDDEAIKGLVKEYLEARDRDDAKAVGALFTDDADQLVSSGEWRKGRDQLVKGTLASTRSGGKRTLRVEHIRHISKDTAIADARYELVGAADTRNMWSTFVVTRTSGGWKIAAIRNMLPAPPAK